MSEHQQEFLELTLPDVLPKLHTDFIERIKKNERKNKRNDYYIYHHLLRRNRPPRPRQFPRWLPPFSPKVSPNKK